MNSTLARQTRAQTHLRFIAAAAAGLAMCLAIPSVALASGVRPAGHATTVVAKHDVGEASKVQISGTIVSLGSGYVVVQDRDGFWRTIVLGTSTTYAEGPMTVTPAPSVSNLAVGTSIAAVGSVDANHLFLDATSIRIQLATARGVVQSVTAGAIVIAGNASVLSRTIDLNGQTVYFSHKAVVTPSPVVVGSYVEGFGIVQSDGSLLALYVGVETPKQSFDHTSDFGFNVPDRLAPNHYMGHLSSK